MPSEECLQVSAQRLAHARNRLEWQRRFALRATDPNVRRLAQRMVVTMEEVVAAMTKAHDLLVEWSPPDQ